MNPYVSKMRQSKILGYFLDTVNVAAVAIMLAVLIVMGIESILDWRALLIAGLSAFFVFSRWKANVMWLILGGAIAGYLLQLI